MNQHPRSNIDALACALARWMVARQHEGRRSTQADDGADHTTSASSTLIEMKRDERAQGEFSYSTNK